MTTTGKDESPAATHGNAHSEDVTDLQALRPSGWHGVPRSRMGGLWVAAVVFALVLLLLLIFVLQNGQSAEVSFLGAHGRLPMGVALLLAAIFGVLLVALPGTARILQLRLLSRRSSATQERVSRRVSSGHQSPSPPTPVAAPVSPVEPPG